MVHYNRNDSRIKVVKDIISPFQLQLNEIHEICKADDYFYWDSVYADDTEHLVGIVFIILQNYINSSISDLFENDTRLYSKYSDDKTIINSKTTRIELIIAIANYYKHRDLSTKLHDYTVKPLVDLGIEYIEMYDDQNDKYIHIVGSCSPVFKGFSRLSKSCEFIDLINIVSEWRENLWLNEEEKDKMLNKV